MTGEGDDKYLIATLMSGIIPLKPDLCKLGLLGSNNHSWSSFDG